MLSSAPNFSLTCLSISILNFSSSSSSILIWRCAICHKAQEEAQEGIIAIVVGLQSPSSWEIKKNGFHAIILIFSCPVLFLSALHFWFRLVFNILRVSLAPNEFKNWGSGDMQDTA